MLSYSYGQWLKKGTNSCQQGSNLAFPFPRYFSPALHFPASECGASSEWVKMCHIVPCLTLMYLWFSLPKPVHYRVMHLKEGFFWTRSKTKTDVYGKILVDENYRSCGTQTKQPSFHLTWYKKRLPPSVNSSLSFSISCFFCSTSSSIWMRCCLCRIRQVPTCGLWVFGINLRQSSMNFGVRVYSSASRQLT